jgi:hypothetical protein
LLLFCTGLSLSSLFSKTPMSKLFTEMDHGLSVYGLIPEHHIFIFRVVARGRSSRHVGKKREFFSDLDLPDLQFHERDNCF